MAVRDVDGGGVVLGKGAGGGVFVGEGRGWVDGWREKGGGFDYEGGLIS